MITLEHAAAMILEYEYLKSVGNPRADDVLATLEDAREEIIAQLEAQELQDATRAEVDARAELEAAAVADAAVAQVKATADAAVAEVNAAIAAKKVVDESVPAKTRKSGKPTEKKVRKPAETRQA